MHTLLKVLLYGVFSLCYLSRWGSESIGIGRKEPSSTWDSLSPASTGASTNKNLIVIICMGIETQVPATLMRPVHALSP